MKAYLAGPMSGIPAFNFPLFESAAALLRGSGWDIVSPAELDKESNAEDYQRAVNSKNGDIGTTKQTWGDFLARDVKLIADEGIEAIIFLPDWELSKGAKLEATVGLLAKLKFYTYEPEETDSATPCSHVYVATQLHSQFTRSKA